MIRPPRTSPLFPSTPLSRSRHKGEPAPKVASVALGSGFIIDPNGYVVTDDHVVENAEAVTVVVQDATEYSARIVGRDPLRSEEHTSELQSQSNLVCRLLLEK